MNGKTPAVALINPKFPHNVGGVLRACAAFGVPQLWITGQRAEWESLKRLPREERMRIYKDQVELIRDERPFDQFGKDVTPVAIEVDPTAEILTNFEHPENALYVFGPEDGTLARGIKVKCHRFVIIPSDHCLNLASAVSCVLMHRRMQRQLQGLEPIYPAYETIKEERGY
jgi:tRNA(Leu) C34 or U34 (ribose-2'-O)-methylase TrmL